MRLRTPIVIGQVSKNHLEEMAQFLNGIAQEQDESTISTPGPKEQLFARTSDVAWQQGVATARQAPEKDAPRSSLLTGTVQLPKFQRPGLPVSLVERLRLLDLLDTTLVHPLALLSAWTARHPRQVAWLSLDEQDRYPARFWITFIEALRQCPACQSGIGEAALRLLQARHSPTLHTILTTLINELTLLAEEMVLILDDYHVIQEQALHESDLPPI